MKRPGDSGRIVFLVSFMNLAGAQEAAVRVARGLRERGRETEVWFLYRETEVPRYCAEPGVRVLLDRERPGAIGYLKIAWRLHSELRRARPYATVSFLPLANVVGQGAALIAGVERRIASARAPVSTYSRPMRIGDRLNARFGVYRGIVAVTREVAGGYRTMPPKVRRRVSVVHNGLVWQPSPLGKAEARARLGLPADRFLAASVGRFKPQKNYPFQVKMAALLDKATIVVAGDGPLRRDTEEQMAQMGVGDRMLLLGNLGKEEMAHLLAACDCFIQPSFYEGQSNALLEAMHAGLPVLVSDVPDQRETLVDDRGEAAGLLLGLDDARPWAEALERLAAQPAEQARWHEAARRRAAAFTLEKQLDGFVRAIDGAHAMAQPPATPAIAGPDTGHPLADRVTGLLDAMYPAVVADLARAAGAPHDPVVSLEDVADVLYTWTLAGRADLITPAIADRLASRLRQTRLAGALSGEPALPLEHAIVHRTAYGLGALALAARAGHDRFAEVLRPDAFVLDELVDARTGLPLYPARYTHHNWRVSHWIGGVPSILANLARHGGPETRAKLKGPFEPGAVVAAASERVSAATGLLRLYRVPALQQGFRTLYRLRHDPDLGDLGGIAHLVWVQHALDAPLIGGRPLFSAARATLMKRKRFMEDMPYCLDFDIIELARVSGERLGATPGDLDLAERARRFHADTRAFLMGEVPASYTLHKFPGALAAMHEAAVLAPDRARELEADLGLGQPVDIIREALWI